MAAPVITPISPLAGATEVIKNASIFFSVVDTVTGVALTETRVWMRGFLVYDGVRFTEGWRQSVVSSITDGYLFNLVPDRFEYARANVEHKVGVNAEDTSSNPSNETWIFTATSELGLGTYRFILGSIRDKDEEQ